MVALLYQAVCFLLTLDTMISAFTYPDACPRITPLEFDKEKLAGNWFEFTHSLDAGYSCSVYSQEVLEVDGEPHSLTLIKSQSRYDNGSVIDEKGLYRIPPTLEGTYPDQGSDGGDIYTYYILDTDYTSYAVGYYCDMDEDDTGIEQEVFVASREKQFEDGLLDKALEVLKKNGITLTIETKPEGCEGLLLPESS